MDYSISDKFFKSDLPCVMLDFDGVASLEPDLFRGFCESLKGIGIDYYVCTSRSISDRTNNEIFDHFPEEKIIFCEGETKKRVTEHLGITVAFWMDDTPEDVIDKMDICARFAI